MTDLLTRFIFEERSIRGEIVSLEKSYRDILDSYDYPPQIQHLLGEMMAATALLTATLKFEGEISLQIQSEGVVRYAVISGTHDLKLRGVSRWNEEMDSLPNDFQSLFHKGYIVITITPKDGERYQGIVGLDKPTLAECLQEYFLQSEQLPTLVSLFVDHDAENTENGQSKKVGGLLLQIMPTSSETSQREDNPDFEHLSTLARTMTKDEMVNLDHKTILHRLYHEEDIRLLSEQPVEFYCACSRERSAAALRNIQKQELLQIINEEGQVKIDCQFCHAKYEFDAMDIENIHANSPLDSSDSTH